MKVSVKWLNTYVSLEGVSPEELAEALTTAGLEVEGIDYQSQGTNLMIGQVMDKQPHPDSDHLNVCQVNLGDGQLHQIVCGAPNVAIGQKVIVARPGAVLPEITIKASKVRGVESNGMICALFELGVDKKMLREDQIEGIEVLPENAPVGHEDPLGWLGLDDAILDVKQTPNRADFMAMWSVAKEVGAILKRPVTLPDCKGASKKGKPTALKVGSTTEKCPVFLGKIIGSIEVGPSPKWMQEHLHAYGMKSINNVVDISNYVMLETGQPLHFYDLAKIPAQEITVVDDVEMTMTALDGVEYEIQKGDLLITTDGRPTGVAGIMGGDDSKIDENTHGIIIESALFNMVSIRTTARRLGLSTEACVRFQKGLEPQAQIKAMDRAVQLLEELAGAAEIEETVQHGTINMELTTVTETLDHINTLLGTQFTHEQVMDVLTRLDLSPVADGTTYTMMIPSYRTDLKIREDIDEEVIRLIGYDELPTTLPTMEATAGRLDPRQTLRRTIRTVLSGLGLNEAVTYTLVNQKFADDPVMPLGQVIPLAWPMSEDRKYIRTSLMNSMMECLSYNQARKAENVNLYEISYVYAKEKMQERLGILLSGNLQQSKLHKIEIPSDFYTLKGLILGLCAKLGFEQKRILIKENTEDTQHFHPYRSACVYLGREFLGVFGQVHPAVASARDTTACIYAELILDVLAENKPSRVKFVPLDRYPSVKRDIALVCDQNITAEKLTQTIWKQDRRLIKDVDVFDVYQGEHVETGKKSVAMSIVYQSADHTLTDKEVSEIHERILNALAKECQAVLRG